MWYEDEVVDTVCSARTACGSWRTGPGYATHVMKHRRNEWVLAHPSTRCLSMTLMSLLRCKEKPNSTADMEVICNPTVDGYCTLLRHILLWLYTCTSIWNMGVLINLKRKCINRRSSQRLCERVMDTVHPPAEEFVDYHLPDNKLYSHQFHLRTSETSVKSDAVIVRLFVRKRQSCNLNRRWETTQKQYYTLVERTNFGRQPSVNFPTTW